MGSLGPWIYLDSFPEICMMCMQSELKNARDRFKLRCRISSQRRLLRISVHQVLLPSKAAWVKTLCSHMGLFQSMSNYTEIPYENTGPCENCRRGLCQSGGGDARCNSPCRVCSELSEAFFAHCEYCQRQHGHRRLQGCL